MPLQVLYHLELLLGPVAAVEAVVGLLVGVGQVVVLQASDPAEGLRTQPAHIWALLTVLLLVSLEQEACLEGLATFLTDEGAHITMAGFPVDTQGIRPVGAILTFLTGVWLGSWQK